MGRIGSGTLGRHPIAEAARLGLTISAGVQADAQEAAAAAGLM